MSRSLGKLLVLMCFVACSRVTPTLADVEVDIYAQRTQFQITNRTNLSHVQAMISASRTTSLLMADIGDETSWGPLDGVVISGYHMEAALTFTGAGNAYSATGTLKIWDAGAGNTTPRIAAAFASDDVQYTPAPNLGGSFVMSGSLSPLAGNESILRPSADPWVFTGTAADSGGGDSDGVATTMTVFSGVAGYDAGSLVSFSFPVGTYANTQDLFAHANPTIDLDGELDVSISASVVPAPGALVLGVLGVATSVTALKRRRLL